ncbi:MAG: hypothetical protein GQ529_10185 [Methyloprofundus sp.]|nr:hypothetical protein [Methyloprofundus sp.]
MAYKAEYNNEFGVLGSSIAEKWPENEIIKKKGKNNHTLGLALSGGGYRSAIFNYGILKGLYNLRVIKKIDYLSSVSGGSWIATPFAMSQNHKWFFDDISTHANFIEEGFESLLVNPLRLAQESALSRKNANYIGNIYGRLLAKTFLREHGQLSRFKELSDTKMIKDSNRPFLIINGTANFRSPNGFSVTQECFEMTRLYCGSRSLGYISSDELKASEKIIRVRDAIAMSGAAVAYHIPALGGEVAGLGLSREVINYAKQYKPDVANTDHIDVSDGGHYNNLGVESLINRGCGYIIIVDAEHDKQKPSQNYSGQEYHGLKTLIERHHIPNPIVEDMIEQLDTINKPLHIFDGTDSTPSILYIKLKSFDQFDLFAKDKEYNQPNFLENIFGRGEFSFNPQYSTAKLDYDFIEHRNLSELGSFIIDHYKDDIKAFVARSN